MFKWYEDVPNTVRIDLSVELSALAEEDLFRISLGRHPAMELDAKELQSFWIKNFKLRQDSAALYYRFPHFYQSIAT